MNVDWFKDILVPVVGGLGIFMLGLEFMSNGIQSLSVNSMRRLLARTAGTPVGGLLAGTVITGVLQSSTAMTVMVVGLVDAGVLSLRPAISVIMGANIGTTLGNGLIALPLGPIGLLMGGIFALVMIFTRSDRVRNVSLALLGFSIIFYGLSLMTGGLRPLRAMPEAMSVISSLKADSYLTIAWSVLIAAVVTALIHSSSATIGIVMGLGASGVLDWQTAVAFALGADLGTTITSFIASLNLSRNAKRAAYAHILFNLVGVAIMLPLFPLVIHVLPWVIGDPGEAVKVDGQDTYPLVPVAVGAFSVVFNVFNTAVMFPFIPLFDRLLSKIGHAPSDELEDFSVPRFLDPALRDDPARAMPAIQMELRRHLDGLAILLAIARRRPGLPEDPTEHHTATDILNREIRAYTAEMLRPGMPFAQAGLLASLIEEADFCAALGETLHQVAHRAQQAKFGPAATQVLDSALDETADALATLTQDRPGHELPLSDTELVMIALAQLRNETLRLGPEATARERGLLVALLGTVERAAMLIARIHEERKSVQRLVEPATT